MVRIILFPEAFPTRRASHSRHLSDLLEQLRAGLSATYDFERELGGGGMSRVFVATETALSRTVVVKVVATDLLEGLSADRFTREVKLAARLQQANIVPLLSAGDANGVPYYTMPFVDGSTLRARIASGSPVPIAEATHILRDVAKALAYAHAHGVVHRDIKPENVLLSGGTAMVTDFGIAKALTVRAATKEARARPSPKSGHRSAHRPTWRPSRRRAIRTSITTRTCIRGA